MKYCRDKAERPTLQWYHDATQLPEEWDDVLPSSHFLKRASLSAHQNADVPDISPVYVTIRTGHQILLQAAFQVLSVKERNIRKDAVKPWQYRAWRGFTKIAAPKMLVAGQLFRHDVSTVFADDKLSAFEAFTLYREAIEAAAAKWHAQAVLVKDCPRHLATLFQHHAPQYLLLRNDISMEMDLRENWAAVSDYEKDLKHKYAQRYRNVRKRIEGLRIVELSTEEVAQRATEIFALYLGVTIHQSVRMGILSEGFLPALKSFYGEELRVWGFFEGDRLIAFASAFVYPQSLDMFYIGFDYVRNTELQLYFNILFFAIEQAIIAKKPHLVLGRTALEAKARVGCSPQYLASFLYIPNGFLRKIVAALQQRFSEGADWEERHPFKS